jgi:hypothetical protein
MVVDIGHLLVGTFLGNDTDYETSHGMDTGFEFSDAEKYIELADKTINAQISKQRRVTRKRRTCFDR